MAIPSAQPPSCTRRRRASRAASRCGSPPRSLTSSRCRAAGRSLLTMRPAGPGGRNSRRSYWRCAPRRRSSCCRPTTPPSHFTPAASQVAEHGRAGSGVACGVRVAPCRCVVEAAAEPRQLTPPCLPRAGLHPDLWHQLYQFMVWEMDPTAAEKVGQLAPPRCCLVSSRRCCSCRRPKVEAGPGRALRPSHGAMGARPPQCFKRCCVPALLQGTLGGRLLKGGGATPFEANFQPYGWDQQINGTARTAL